MMGIYCWYIWGSHSWLPISRSENNKELANLRPNIQGAPSGYMHNRELSGYIRLRGFSGRQMGADGKY